MTQRSKEQAIKQVKEQGAQNDNPGARSKKMTKRSMEQRNIVKRSMEQEKKIKRSKEHRKIKKSSGEM